MIEAQDALQVASLNKYGVRVENLADLDLQIPEEINDARALQLSYKQQPQIEEWLLTNLRLLICGITTSLIKVYRVGRRLSAVTTNGIKVGLVEKLT